MVGKVFVAFKLDSFVNIDYQNKLQITEQKRFLKLVMNDVATAVSEN